MHMYQKIAIVLISVLAWSVQGVFAVQSPTSVTVTYIEGKWPVTMKEFFTEYCTTIGKGIPEAYKQIPLKTMGVKRTDPLYNALQKCVYLGFIPNSALKYQWSATVTTRFVNNFMYKTLKLDPDIKEDELHLTRETFARLIEVLPNYETLINIGDKTAWWTDPRYYSQLINAQWFDMISQIYETLKNEYRTGDSIGDDVLIGGAIKWMVNAVGDRHTTFFPPAEAEGFNDQLNGSFEWIGAYLDMPTPGEVIITSLIKDSPSQKAWLMTNDRIIKVNGYTVTENDTLDTVISRIKWPAGSVVTLTITRQVNTMEVKVTRGTITISMLDYTVKSGTPVISINIFGRGVANTWKETLAAHKGEIQNADKIIIDLRDNPGGSLQDVADILSDFVPKDQPVVVTKMRAEEHTIVSAWRNTIDFSKKKILLLINEWTASAAEIMAGTIKDYFPNAVIIGETSFGKGSVQYLYPLQDGSSFKLTVAHWYTGKTKKAIEWIGIVPDLFVSLDMNLLKNGYDTQLEAAVRN